MHSKACVLQYTFNSVTRKLNSLIVSYFCVLSRVLILSMVLTTLWCLYDSVTPLLLCSYTPCNIFQIVIKTCTWNTWLNWSNKRHTFLENTNFKQELHFFPSTSCPIPTSSYIKKNEDLSFGAHIRHWKINTACSHWYVEGRNVDFTREVGKSWEIEWEWQETKGGMDIGM